MLSKMAADKGAGAMAAQSMPPAANTCMQESASLTEEGTISAGQVSHGQVEALVWRVHAGPLHPQRHGGHGIVCLVGRHALCTTRLSALMWWPMGHVSHPSLEQHHVARLQPP